MAGASGDTTLNGGTGNDTINLNSSITFAADKSLDVNLQDDDASPGNPVDGAGRPSQDCGALVWSHQVQGDAGKGGCKILVIGN